MEYDPKDLEFELSSMDPNQIQRYQHSEKHNAQRVIVVGGQMDIKVDAQFPEFKFPEPQAPQIIEKPIIVKEIEIREIEKPIYIKEIEIREIEKPIYIKEIEIKEVIKEVPMIQEKIVMVEKPIIVEKEKFSEFPKELKFLLMAQAIAMFGLLLVNIFKH